MTVRMLQLFLIVAFIATTMSWSPSVRTEWRSIARGSSAIVSLANPDQSMEGIVAGKEDEIVESPSLLDLAQKAVDGISSSSGDKEHAKSSIADEAAATTTKSDINEEEVNESPSLLDMAASTMETVSDKIDTFDLSLPGDSQNKNKAPTGEKESKIVTEDAERSEDNPSDIFDITSKIFDSSSPNFLSKLISPIMKDEDGESKVKEEDIPGDKESSFFDKIVEVASTSGASSKLQGPSIMESFEETSKTWMHMITNVDGDSIKSVLNKAQDMKWEEGQEIEKTSMLEVHDAIQQVMTGITTDIDDFFGGESIPIPSLTSLQYYLERTDEVKNPSWKRRMHRFFPKVKVGEMDILNEKLQLARLAYANTVEDIRETLDTQYDCQLLFCDPKAKPNKPAHFLAVKKNQPLWSDSLQVYLVVCGTKTVLDVVTDLICEAAPYRDGFAHAGITASGQYIAEKHIGLLEKLRDESGKSKIKINMLGHSLGAGCAAITAMEWNDHDFIDVEMTGFGCPALLSKELAEQSSEYLTTVISDNDCIPRMSFASLVNALLDIVQFDYTSYARRDLEDVVGEIELFLPSLLSGSMDRKKIMDSLNKMLPDDASFKRGPDKRLDVVLFPPGTAIHFFFDGFGVTGCRVPSTFFNELDVHRRMIHDHLFDTGYNKIFLDLMRQHHNDNHYAFSYEEALDERSR